MWRPERSQTTVGHVSHAGVETTGRLGVATFQKETLLASSVADNREGGTSHPFGSVVGRMSALAYPHPWKWGKCSSPHGSPHTTFLVSSVPLFCVPLSFRPTPFWCGTSPLSFLVATLAKHPRFVQVGVVSGTSQIFLDHSAAPLSWAPRVSVASQICSGRFEVMRTCQRW